MTKANQTLRPGVGIGGLKFGATRDEVERALGQPTAIDDEAIPDWILWDYPELGYELAFDAEEDVEDARLVSLRCDHTGLEIADRPAIGLDRDHLLELETSLGWGESESETNADGEEEIDYPEIGLMFSLRNGTTVAVSAAALVDDADQYVWP
jgi:hypothetical protein